MSSLQVLIFFALLAFILGKAFVKPQRFLEYPYFMAATFLVFILPQVISLKRFPGSAPLESLTPVMVMTNLCLACCYFGYLLPPNRWIARHSRTPVNLNRLFQIGLVFIVTSYFFTFLISRMSAEETGGSMWTGRVTIYQFFSQLVYIGMGITLLAALSRRSALAWIATAAAAVIPIYSIVFAGRRESAALFVLTIGLTYFYHRRWIPSRGLVAASLGFAMIAIPATGTYRGVMQQKDFSAARQIDLIGNFRRFLNEESILELRNAAVLIYSTRARGEYKFGTGYWDQLVFRFVPAQLVGKDVKDSLMFDKRETDSSTEDPVEIGIRSFTAAKGSTETGMADSFQQFGFFGCLFFALLAVIFRSLWETSLQPNSYFAKLLYIQTSTSAMRAVTHQTVDYFPGLLYNLVFIGFAVLYAYSPNPKNRRTLLVTVGDDPVGKFIKHDEGRDREAAGKSRLAPLNKRDLSEIE